MKTVRYEVLLDPGKENPYKTINLNNAVSDEEAFAAAKQLSLEKGWEITRLSRIVQEDLIPYKAHF